MFSRTRPIYPENFTRELGAEPDIVSFWRAVKKIAEDPLRGVAELEDLSNRGSALSMVYIGDVYERGGIVDIDTNLADIWYGRAAGSGSIEGKFRLAASLWHDGDYISSEIALKELVNLGFSPAMYCLGSFYYSGNGVGLDRERGIRLLSMADMAGHLLARQMISYIYRTGACGRRKIILGWIKLVQLIFVGSWWKLKFPESDRFRGW